MNPATAQRTARRKEPGSDRAVISGLRFVADLLAGQTQLIWSAVNNQDPLDHEANQRTKQELEKIEKQIGQLESVAGTHANQDARRQLRALHDQVDMLRRQIQAHLHAWRKTELARHPQRPYTLDYIERIFADFSEVHGDRGYADDHAIVGGMAKFQGEQVMVIGHQKGRDTKQKVLRNWGMPNPEGYRKALRLMRMAEKFGRPIFTFVDTPGAFHGMGAEERGQGEAIARNLREMARIAVPIIVTVIGEGGSGGALAIAVGDRVLMLENAIYSVISPEGCAAIMWRDAARKDLAAEALRITSEDLSALGIIDGIVPEPEGGAQANHDHAAALLGQALAKHLDELKTLSPQQLLDGRYEKFRKMAQFYTE